MTALAPTGASITVPIAAIATAPGRGAVGIVRVSGTGLAPLVETLCGRALQPRVATHLPFLDGQGGAIDTGLALYFPAPHSYTGEDVLELQAHGGAVVMQLLLARCLEAGKALDMGIRVARAGEFTERAFLNDKLDLAQAEAVSDLIDASTEAAARSASRSLSGDFSQTIHVLRDALIHLRMLVEATLDFPEEDIDFLQQADARGQLARLQEKLAAVMQRTQQGALLREGIKLVIAGQPNAGKSSLLNALAGAELAIVTPIAGTTRDVVQQTIQIEGVPIHVLDTAGLRDSTLEAVDQVEQIGIARAWQHIETADVILFLHDLTKQDDAPHTARDKALQAALPAGRTVIDVWNKADLSNAEAAANNWGRVQGTKCSEAKRRESSPDPNWLATRSVTLSAKTGAGLTELRAEILQAAGWQAAPEGLFIARQRHVTALQGVGEHLQLASDHLNVKSPALEVIAEELRLAQLDLNAITGEFTPDDLLGEIFSKFCIGK
jgi:tRNA modification GTPase